MPLPYAQTVVPGTVKVTLRQVPVLEALQVTRDNLDEVAAFTGWKLSKKLGEHAIFTEPEMRTVAFGSWVLRGVTGNVFAVTAQAFDEIYIELGRKAGE